MGEIIVIQLKIRSAGFRVFSVGHSLLNIEYSAIYQLLTSQNSSRVRWFVC